MSFNFNWKVKEYIGFITKIYALVKKLKMKILSVYPLTLYPVIFYRTFGTLLSGGVFDEFHVHFGINLLLLIKFFKCLLNFQI
jgi:hypothetical protein